MSFFFVIELLLAVPEFIEFSMPTWYGTCLALSLVPGCATLFYYFRWIFKDNEANRKGLIFAYQLKWLQHAFDCLAFLLFLSSLSEEDYIKYLGSDETLAEENAGRYQFMSFFGAFLFCLIDMIFITYLLNKAHIFEILHIHQKTKYQVV